MVVRSIGNSLKAIFPSLVGKKLTDCFDLVRPLIFFKFLTVSIKAILLIDKHIKKISIQILNRTNNIFELISIDPISNTETPLRRELMLSETDNEDFCSKDQSLRLKGNFLTSQFCEKIILQFGADLRMFLITRVYDKEQK